MYLYLYLYVSISICLTIHLSIYPPIDASFYLFPVFPLSVRHFSTLFVHFSKASHTDFFYRSWLE